MYRTGRGSVIAWRQPAEAVAASTLTSPPRWQQRTRGNRARVAALTRAGAASFNLTVQDIVLNTVLDAPALSSSETLAIANVQLDAVLDSPTLSTDNSTTLAAQDVTLNLVADSPTLTNEVTLAIADVLLFQFLDSPALGLPAPPPPSATASQLVVGLTKDGGTVAVVGLIGGQVGLLPSGELVALVADRSVLLRANGQVAIRL